MDIYAALAEPTRRSIVELLSSRGRLSATDIAVNFPVSAPAVSQHLKVLREAELVTVEKRAQKRMYSINPRKMTELEEWARKMKQSWNRRLDALEQVLAEEKAKQV